MQFFLNVKQKTYFNFNNLEILKMFRWMFVFLASCSKRFSNGRLKVRFIIPSYFDAISNKDWRQSLVCINATDQPQTKLRKHCKLFFINTGCDQMRMTLPVPVIVHYLVFATSQRDLLKIVKQYVTTSFREVQRFPIKLWSFAFVIIDRYLYRSES